MHKKILAFLLALCLCLSLGPAAFANNTFTITYRTNAGAEIKTLTYTVDDPNNAFPTLATLGSTFPEFVRRVSDRGGVYVPSNQADWWYSDQELTARTTFPKGQADENYTVYLKFTVGAINAGSVENNAENKSYSETIPELAINGFGLTLSLSGQYVIGRFDGGTAIAVFEKYENGEWVTVDDSYRTDIGGNTWPNRIYFYDVSDSGTYRLKYLRYTATDHSGNVLFYDYGYLPNEEVYTVSIAPVELTISDVTATSRDYDGTNSVELSGGTLSGVLFGDDVSFELGTGTIADVTPGQNKAVTTNIKLTGEKAGNYVLAQPTDVTVNITGSMPAPPPKPAGTTTVEIGGEAPGAQSPEENPNTGAYVPAAVLSGILAGTFATVGK